MIEQRGEHDCGVAAFANALGITYEEALQALGFRDPNREVVEFEGQRHVGIIPEEFSLAAFKRGIPCHVVTVMEIQDKNSWMYAWRDVFFRMRIEDVATAVFDEGMTAILGVDSKNYPGNGHWITVKDGQVLDPSPKVKYEQGEVLPMQVAVLFASPHRIASSTSADCAMMRCGTGTTNQRSQSSDDRESRLR